MQVTVVNMSCRVVLLLKDPGSAEFRPAKEVSDGGRRYAITSAGSEFRVEVKVPDLQGHMRASLRIDGQSVGYSKVCSPGHRSVVFKGWFAGLGEYTAFIFSSATAGNVGGGTGAPSQETGLGKVEVTLTHEREEKCGLEEPSARRKRGHAHPRCSHCKAHERWYSGRGVSQAKAGAPTLSATGSAGDDKKFFFNPSLRATSTGMVCHSVELGRSPHLTPIPGLSPVVVTLHCETAEFLILRGILPRPEPRQLQESTDQVLGTSRSRQGEQAETVKQEERVSVKDEQDGSTRITRVGVKMERSRSDLAGLSKETAIVLPDEDDVRSRQSGRRRRCANPVFLSDDDSEAEGGGRKRRRRNMVSDNADASSVVYMWEEHRALEVVELS